MLRCVAISVHDNDQRHRRYFVYCIGASEVINMEETLYHWTGSQTNLHCKLP